MASAHPSVQAGQLLSWCCSSVHPTTTIMANVGSAFSSSIAVCGDRQRLCVPR
ncbi:hypothetical protein BaRGS_00027165, partial [Batillaria attramentaria]